MHTYHNRYRSLAQGYFHRLTRWAHRLAPRLSLSVFIFVSAIFSAFLLGCDASSTASITTAHPAEKRLATHLPPGWAARYDGDGIRWGSFYHAGTQAQVSVTRFPGGVGDELSNINRWRQQLGLEPSPSAQMLTLESAGLRWRWVWIVGRKEMIAAAMAPAEGTTWVLKLTGPASAEAILRGDFEKILQFTSFQ